MRKQQHQANAASDDNNGNENQKTEEMGQLEKIIDIQKGEIRKLRVQIKDLEHLSSNRPPSGGKLPPVPVI